MRHVAGWVGTTVNPSQLFPAGGNKCDTFGGGGLVGVVPIVTVMVERAPPRR